MTSSFERHHFRESAPFGALLALSELRVFHLGLAADKLAPSTNVQSFTDGDGPENTRPGFSPFMPRPPLSCRRRREAIRGREQPGLWPHRGGGVFFYRCSRRMLQGCGERADWGCFYTMWSSWLSLSLNYEWWWCCCFQHQKYFTAIAAAVLINISL